MQNRGRPKGQTKDQRSYGPLGDLMRKTRLSLGIGLSDVAHSCNCSVQFISNIEHGRAPLPWNKVECLAVALKLDPEKVQAANLAARADIKRFCDTSKGKKSNKSSLLKNIAGVASVITIASKDSQLQEIIQRYQSASVSLRKKFLIAALEMLNH